MFLQVDGDYGVSNTFSLQLTFIPAPANDNFSNRTLVTGSTTVFGSNVGATGELDEPQQLQWSGTSHSVWYVTLSFKLP